MELFKIGFLTVSIIDIIDISIVAILCFWLYRALRNTIAVQILFGLVIIIGLKFITEALSFKSLNWILQTISDIWLLAFIILFQPELRKVMVLITRSPLFKLFVKSRISATLEEVIDAVIEMSEYHVGALLVFPRSQNVQMTVETGIPLQAKVSRELLLSVFNTKSALHDGAVIIDNQMIVAARCVLPLTTLKKFKSKNLGTRHRAGLGLSEQTDAVVLIVSEETGSISIAESGMLDTDIPKEQLSNKLKEKLAH
jgi:diadenylate cyclase